PIAFAAVTDANCSKVVFVPPAKIGDAADQWSATGVPTGGKLEPVVPTVGSGARCAAAPAGDPTSAAGAAAAAEGDPAAVRGAAAVRGRVGRIGRSEADGFGEARARGSWVVIVVVDAMGPGTSIVLCVPSVKTLFPPAS